MAPRLGWAFCTVFGLAACSDWHISSTRDRHDDVEDDEDSAPIVDPVDTDSAIDSPIDTAVEETGDPIIPGEPIANAGPDQNVQPLDHITLDGSASYDPQGLEPLAYKWSLVSKPTGSNSFFGPLQVGKEYPSFWTDIAGRYVFKLTVQNTAGIWDSTPDKVVIEAIPTAKKLYVQLTWDAACDLDLHVLNGTGAAIFDKPGDCCFCNKNPGWYTAATTDDPSLDWDDIQGYGPETTTIEIPANGTYVVKVHYYGLDGNASCMWDTGSTVDCPDTMATLRVFVDAVEVATYTHTLTEDDQIWYVADVDWPYTAVTPVNTMESTTLSGCF